MIHPPEAPQAKEKSATQAYRADQGRHARMVAFWSLALLIFFGCTFVHDQLLAHWDVMARSFTVPYVEWEISNAFLAGFVVFAIGMIWLIRFERKPNVRDMLIDTEGELRKVTWPTAQDVMNSSMVVIVAVVIIGLFMAAADFLLARIMRNLILGG